VNILDPADSKEKVTLKICLFREYASEEKMSPKRKMFCEATTCEGSKQQCEVSNIVKTPCDKVDEREDF
jgi:hypothetical protein